MIEIVERLAVVTRVTNESRPRRRFGVPPGGPFDRRSFALACVLADADEALEVAFGGLTVRATAPCALSVVGMPVQVIMRGRPQPGNGVWPLEPGEVVQVLAGQSGARYYLATGRRPVRQPIRLADEFTAPETIRVVDGPQSEQVPITLSESLTVTMAADRVGVRLEPRQSPHTVELPSEPACPGAIQITPDGTPIVLGPDGPTIGGYPKPAIVCSADLDLVGQMRPGHSVRFLRIELDEARQLLAEYRQDLDRRLQTLRLALQG